MFLRKERSEQALRLAPRYPWTKGTARRTPRRGRVENSAEQTADCNRGCELCFTYFSRHDSISFVHNSSGYDVTRTTHNTDPRMGLIFTTDPAWRRSRRRAPRRITSVFVSPARPNNNVRPRRKNALVSLGYQSSTVRCASSRRVRSAAPSLLPPPPPPPPPLPSPPPLHHY